MDLLAGALGSRNRLDTLYPELREEFAHRTEDLSARDGLADYLDFASHHGIRLACASSSFQTYIRRWLTGLGLLSRFDAVVTRNDVPEGRIKPWPDIYREALRRLSLPPVAAIAFEDSAVGAAAAEAAGLVCVLVPNRATERRVARCPNYKLNMVQTPPARLLQALELEMP